MIIKLKQLKTVKDVLEYFGDPDFENPVGYIGTWTFDGSVSKMDLLIYRPSKTIKINKFLEPVPTDLYLKSEINALITTDEKYAFVEV